MAIAGARNDHEAAINVVEGEDMADHSPSALRTQCTAEFARRVERAGTYREDRIGKKREAEPKRNGAEAGR